MRTEKLGRLVARRDTRGAPELPLLGVSVAEGVRARAEDDGRPAPSLDLSGYKRVMVGDIIMNALGKPHGSIGRSPVDGITSPAYWVLRTGPELDGGFAHHLLRSTWAVQRFAGLGKNLPPNQFDIPWEVFREISAYLPPLEQQRRIADFLDDRVARIDKIIAARRKQISLAETALFRASYDTVRGVGRGDTRPSGLDWLGQIPQAWPLCTVATEFQVDLGKMLDEKRQTGIDTIPYLRNTNVQWDRVNVDDLKSMDIAPEERVRYAVKPGDLLICEGGQPGRAALWPGGLEPLGFQKALHRARSRGRSREGWLLECLRAAVFMNVFAVENGQTTIGHLTNEQLRALKFPFPDASIQDLALKELEAVRESVRTTGDGLTGSIDLLTEYKQSLITAAVTGELDVTTAGSGIPG